MQVVQQVWEECTQNGIPEWPECLRGGGGGDRRRLTRRTVGEWTPVPV